MMSIKAGRPLIALAKLCHRANRSLLVVGKHGIGKSENLQQAAQELRIDCVVYDLSIMEPTDLVGLPRMQGKRTVYCPPKSLPTTGKGFLVFEELNRAPLYMRAPCLNLLTTRRLNDYDLPAGWLPVAAINPPEEGYEVSDLDPALRSRFVQVMAEADRDEWLAWARGHDVHPDVIGYVESDQAIFEADESNPRSWKYVSDMLYASSNMEDRQHMLQVAISGLVGCERAGSFLSFIADQVRPLTAKQVLTGYDKHRKHLLDWVAGGQLDLVEGSLLAVKTQLQSKAHFQAVHENDRRRRNLGNFLKDLPGDLREDAERFFKEHNYPLPHQRRNRA